MQSIPLSPSATHTLCKSLSNGKVQARETNSTIHWIEIYPVGGVSRILNNWGQYLGRYIYRLLYLGNGKELGNGSRPQSRASFDGVNF